MKKILILFGGPSLEHLVSCKSAKNILENIDYKKYEVTACGISKNNIWYIFNDSTDLLDNGNWLSSPNNEYVDNIINFLNSFDVVFPIIHGKLGEDGKIQAMLDMFDIKYIGSSTLSSAISYDKILCKKICSYHNIKQVKYIIINDDYNIPKIESNLSYPMIVKPSCSGSSIGINIANNKKELKTAIKAAKKIDNNILIEEYIIGIELECAIIGNKKIHTSSIGQIKTNNSFYDFDAKYKNKSKLIIPANIDNDLKLQIQNISKDIYIILDCKDYARIDFLYDNKNKELYFNEINTIPGFTITSMYPKLFNYNDLNLKQLITNLIENC